MQIIKYKGGLGNQMFQYAFGRMLEEQYNEENVMADFSYYENYVDYSGIRVPRILQMNIKIQMVSEKQLKEVYILKHNYPPTDVKYKVNVFLENLINKKYYFEHNRDWRDPSKLLSYEYLDGYWQSWKYLEGLKEQLQKEFTLKNPAGEKTKRMIEFCKNHNSVMLGIRKGDYELDKTHYGCFDQEYYHHCMQYIANKIENPIFIIFSNDIEWVKTNMNFKNYTVIFRTEEDQDSDLEELFIMSACKHNIIVNSTYQWWGAWLNSNPDKLVMAPRKWFADHKPIDIVPSDWIKC